MKAHAGILLLLAIAATGAPPRPRKRDADFESVRTHLDHAYVNASHDPPEKYFHESTFNGHYDGRFARKMLVHDERRARLSGLVRTYASFMSSLGAETWLMHGTLLGWYWNRRILPWDGDIDVMVSEKSLDHLASFYNMTVHQYRCRGDDEPLCSYLLEINPHCWNGSVDLDNKVDGRWIDMDAGTFIDITTLRRDPTAGSSEVVMVKDEHRYMYDDIYPLRPTSFEGVRMNVPYAYAKVLSEEYGSRSLSMRVFGDHKFDLKHHDWVLSKSAPLRPSDMTFWQRLRHDWSS